MTFRRYRIATQFTRFGLVGVMNVAINAAVYSSLIYIGAHYIAASAAGTSLGIINAFAWGRFYVFATRGRALTQLLRTIVVYLLQIGVSWAGLIIMIELFQMNPYAAYAANIVVVTLVSFFGLKYFAFRSDDRHMGEARR